MRAPQCPRHAITARKDIWQNCKALSAAWLFCQKLLPNRWASVLAGFYPGASPGLSPVRRGGAGQIPLNSVQFLSAQAMRDWPGLFTGPIICSWQSSTLRIWQTPFQSAWHARQILPPIRRAISHIFAYRCHNLPGINCPLPP